MARKDGRTDLRAYQILNAAGKMVGKKIDARKLDMYVAYEVVQRDNPLAAGEKCYAYRIVAATSIGEKGEVKDTNTLQGGDLMTLNQVTEQIALYRKFSNAPVKTQTEDEDGDDVDRWHGKLEIEFKCDKDMDADEAFDAVWIAKNGIEERDGGIFIRLPQGMSFVGATTPEDNIFKPQGI